MTVSGSEPDLTLANDASDCWSTREHKYPQSIFVRHPTEIFRFLTKSRSSATDGISIEEIVNFNMRETVGTLQINVKINESESATAFHFRMLFI